MSRDCARFQSPRAYSARPSAQVSVTDPAANAAASGQPCSSFRSSSLWRSAASPQTGRLRRDSEAVLVGEGEVALVRLDRVALRAHRLQDTGPQPPGRPGLPALGQHGVGDEDGELQLVLVTAVQRLGADREQRVEQLVAEDQRGARPAFALRAAAAGAGRPPRRRAAPWSRGWPADSAGPRRAPCAAGRVRRPASRCARRRPADRSPVPSGGRRRGRACRRRAVSVPPRHAAVANGCGLSSWRSKRLLPVGEGA